MQTHINVAEAAQRLGRDVRHLVIACGNGQVPNAQIANDGSWWVPIAWVDSQARMNQAARTTQAAPDAAPDQTNHWKIAAVVLGLLTVAVTLLVAWFKAPWLYLVVGAVAVLVGVLSLRGTLKLAKSHAIAGVVLGVFAIGIGGFGMYQRVVRADVAVATRANNAAIAERVAAQRAEDERLAQEAHAAEIERLTTLAPEVIARWRTAAEAARDTVIRDGEVLPNLTVFDSPPGEVCPGEIPACAAAFEELRALQAEVAPLNNWLSAYAQLADAESTIRENRVIRRAVYDGWRALVHEAEQEPEDCPSRICSSQRRSKVRSLSSAITRRQRNILVSYPSVRDMQLRYADLRESRQPIELRNVVVQSSTYYNCAFGSQSRWRSIEIGSVLGGSVHGYCPRGDGWCDNLHRLAGSGARVESVTLEYPRRNSVCEEGQAQLIGYR